MTDILKIEQDKHVRTLVLHRPEKKNALSSELAWGIVDAIQEASRDDDTWVIAITGTGDAFCSGLDLTGQGEDRSPRTPQGNYLDDIHWVGEFLLTLRSGCDKPIVAGVNGVAVGAGLSLAMAADIRLISGSARMMAGYPRIGGSPDGGLTFTLTQALGYEQAMRFLLENRTVMGEEAVTMGLAGELVEDSKMAERLQAYCQMLAERSPITLRLTKRGLERATRSVDLESQVRLELGNIRRAFSSEDGREARQAFLEKRDPVFKGR